MQGLALCYFERTLIVLLRYQIQHVYCMYIGATVTV